jgi:hypothetical protein
VTQGLGRVALTGIAALVGLIVAVIVTLNLHIAVGLEQGYAATPAEVFDRSVMLGVFDLLLLLAGPAAGVLLLQRLRRASRRG